MLIALDFDGTYTADPELWDMFIENVRARGHEIIIATMRYAGREEKELLDYGLDKKVDKIIYTNRLAKKDEVRKQYDRYVDIWIDDNPGWLFANAIPPQ